MESTENAQREQVIKILEEYVVQLKREMVDELLKTSLQYSHPPLLSASKLDYNQNLPCMLPGSHLLVFRSRLTIKEIVKHIY